LQQLLLLTNHIGQGILDTKYSPVLLYGQDKIFLCEEFSVQTKMGKQKIVLKLPLDDERKRRKAFKAAVGMNGVTSATMEGDKIIIVGDGVDPISLTTMLRRSLGYAELLSVSSGDDKKKGDGYGYGSSGGMMYGGGGGGMGGSGAFGGGKEGKEGKESGGGKSSSGHAGYGGGGHYQAMQPVSYPAYQQYNPMPSYPAVYSYPAAYPQQEHDPGCSIM